MDKSNVKYEVPDLFYPDAAKKDELKYRRSELMRSRRCTYMDDLMTKSVAGVICRHNPETVLRLFEEMCTDTGVMNYRLDALEDIMRNPRLSPVIHKVIRTLNDGECRNLSSVGAPDSFAALSDRIEMLETYIECMNELHSLYEAVKGELRSKAFEIFFKSIEERLSSEDHKELVRDVTELKAAFSQKIRSVTVAVNFNEEMRPVSAGIVSWSDKPAGEKPSVFDRIFFRNSAFSDTVVSGKLRTGKPDDNGYVSEADRALFRSLEKLTSAYIGRLDSALKAYDRLSPEKIGLIENQLEVYDGVIRMITSCEARGIKMCRPEYSDIPRTARIDDLFDPCFYFKAAAADTEAKGDGLIVRNSLTMDGDGRFYILTGANNGGKTTFVRGTGLCFLLAQTGFYVPAARCVIAPCDFIFTHFPKEEETGINASRFTAEIKEFKSISELITENSLLLMNESIQSTTPKECAEIASELVRIFCIIGVRGIFATHITEVALSIKETAADPDCKSLPVSITARTDEESGKRLYKICRGEPSGQSYAKDIFRSFGISIDEVRKKHHG